MNRVCRFPTRAAICVAALILASPNRASAAEQETPGRYFVDYPAAEQFCPPIRTAFQDAATTARVVKGRRINQHPNGGYGLPLMKSGGRPLYHTGTDIGWFREGEPVFAIADGVVRSSQAPARVMLEKAGVRLPRKKPIDYGNLIIIEHRETDGDYFFSIYAHLGNDRRVRMGDLVTAGQQIGTIGRKSAAINGGYDPHLHFGIRDGRMREPGQKLFDLTGNGGQLTVRLVEPAEPRCRVAVDPEPPHDLEFPMFGRTVDLRRDEDGFSIPSFVLYGSIPADLEPRFPGYHLSLDGWHNPISFLRERRADRDPPAPYLTTELIPHDEAGNLLGDPAPPWQVEQWIQPVGTESLEIEDFRGRVVCLFFIRAACRGSRSHGFPALARVAQHFRDDDDVAVILLQPPAGDRRLNTIEDLQRIARELPPEIPVGQCAGGDELPAIVRDYHIRGTPWTTIVDREGTVQFSNYTVRPEEIIRRIEAEKSARPHVRNRAR